MLLKDEKLNYVKSGVLKHIFCQAWKNAKHERRNQHIVFSMQGDAFTRDPANFPREKERERRSIRRRERKRELFKRENRIAALDGELRVKIRGNIFPRFFFAQASDVLRTADQYPIKRGWSTACLSIYYISPSRGLWSTLPWIFEPLTEDVRRKRD